MQPAIIDRGRGPEIAGSRITVYDVLAETQAGATPEQLAGEWGLQVEQIQAALCYIEEHREEVLADYRDIQARHARGNPPEIQAKMEASHARFLERVEELRRQRAQGVNGARDEADRGTGRMYVP
jgi:uncharacterized protein (DUF433 family)